MDLDDIEAKLNKLKLVKQIEHVFILLEGGPKHGAKVSAIRAEDPAEAERSVVFPFDEEESKMVFEAARAALQVRYDRLRAEIGAQ